MGAHAHVIALRVLEGSLLLDLLCWRVGYTRSHTVVDIFYDSSSTNIEMHLNQCQ